MIKLKYDDFGRASFQQAVQKLKHSPMKTVQAFSIKHMVKDIEAGLKKLQFECSEEIFKKYAVGGEKTVPPVAGGKSLELQLPFEATSGMEADAKQALDDFGNRTIELNRKKLNPGILFECNEWTPRELEALESIVDEPPLE